MKKRYIFTILLLFLIIGTAGWYYYPQYKINQIKKESMVVKNDKKDTNQETYLEYLKQSPKSSFVHIVLGDSVAQGRGSDQGGFPVKVNKSLENLTGKKFELENLGVSGATSKGLVNQLKQPAVLEAVQKADIISINIGGNDIVQVAKTEGPLKAIQGYDHVKNEYEKNLQDIFKVIRSQNPNAILVLNELYNVVNTDKNYYPASEKLLNDWNLIAYETALSNKPALVVPVSEALPTKDMDKWLYDSIHPNEEGYERIAEKTITVFKNHSYKTEH
ncbi:GDSL-type esterase/lipase family protein [Fictibacillus barbaricus]|uniref:Lysophospholipase L1-like esterase n=1 Tax=Fictibacillus barbaricus TaxID=182136 RepID=A0ABU1TYQ8_9BACL|nr:GDSL-type esterase/lipase family protein [Fictibacillus barbaricus]MDR7072342.1 lysophospholipase L1-like esterase [Fictibacillus barbaricus]